MSEWANASVETVKDPLIMEYAKVNNLGYKIAKKEMIGGGYTPIKREGAPKKGHLHKTKEHAKEIFKKNNQTNNDIFGVTKINNLLEYDLHGSAQRKDVWHETDPGNVEDALIWAMDYKKSKRATKREYRKLNPSKRDLKKQNK